jgi:endonuclease/exonuclease/phosphatase family metal-dependent hydrolase
MRPLERLQKESFIISNLTLALVVLFSLAPERLHSQTHFKVGFYNVENLFDTQDDPLTDDDEYTPKSVKEWNELRLSRKIDSLAKVIAAMDADVLGLCEVENEAVLKLLVQRPSLKKKAYQFVHYNSRYSRGADVAMLYSPRSFQVLHSQPYPLHFEFDTAATTRDILYVRGLVHKKDTLHLLVNHWPSRRNEEIYRLRAAKEVKKIIAAQKIKNSLIIIGDFNDEPFNESIYNVLQARGKLEDTPEDGFFNPFYALAKEQKLGTHSYRGHWNLLDQAMLSPNLVRENGKWRYKVGSATIFSPSWLKNKYNEPYRTYTGDRYSGGFSDHFPIFITLEKNNGCIR